MAKHTDFGRAQGEEGVATDHDFPTFIADSSCAPIDAFWYGSEPQAYGSLPEIGVEYDYAQDTGFQSPYQWDQEPYQPDDLSRSSTQWTGFHSDLSHDLQWGYVTQHTQGVGTPVLGSSRETFSAASSFAGPLASETSARTSDGYQLGDDTFLYSQDVTAASGPIPSEPTTHDYTAVDAYDSLCSLSCSAFIDDAPKYYIVDGPPKRFHCAFKHVGRSGQVETCPRSYQRKDGVLDHYKTIHGDKSQRPWCDKCKRNYSNKSNFRRHLKKSHDDDNASHAGSSTPLEVDGTTSKGVTLE